MIPLSSSSPTAEWWPLYKRMLDDGYSNADVLRVAAVILEAVAGRLTLDVDGRANKELQRAWSLLLQTAEMIAAPEM
jgi:hypothetical protein